MTDRALRIINLGVQPSYAAAAARRIQVMNVVGVVGAIFDAAYAVVLTALYGSAFVPLTIANSISIVWLLSAVLLNSRLRHDAARWTLLGAGWFNLTTVAFFLGVDTGGFLYLLLLPLPTILIDPPGRVAHYSVSAVAFVSSMVAVLVVDPDVPSVIAGTTAETVLLIVNALGTAFIMFIVNLHFRQATDVAEAGMLEANERSERLLLNVLPEEIAERLKAGEAVIADRAEAVTVLFADLVGSTEMSERFTADEMVEMLNDLFTPFDNLADAMGLEKIKTIGDAYMVVGGLPVPRPDHVSAVADMALAMREELANHWVAGFGRMQMRFGIHTGPVVAGVIGRRKFSYDLWGDTVNTAARMESHGVPGEIQVTSQVREALGDGYAFESRGVVDIKGKGQMETFFLGPRS